VREASSLIRREKANREGEGSPQEKHKQFWERVNKRRNQGRKREHGVLVKLTEKGKSNTLRARKLKLLPRVSLGGDRATAGGEKSGRGRR